VFYGIRQGLPDFSWKTYLNGEKYQMTTQCTKWQRNSPIGRKYVYQMAIKDIYKSLYVTLFKIYPKLFENVPSGNPALNLVGRLTE
jgi:hypothetical protein